MWMPKVNSRNSPKNLLYREAKPKGKSFLLPEVTSSVREGLVTLVTNMGRNIL